MISVELPKILTEVTVEDFLLQDNDWLKGVSGLYMLYDKYNTLLYIGISINLRSRLKNHISGYGNSSDFYQHISKMVLYRVDDKTDMEIYESWSIRELRPIYNRAKTNNNFANTRISEHINELEQRKVDILESIREINDGYDVFELDEEYFEDEFYSLGNELKKRQLLDELSDKLDEINNKLGRLRASQSS